MNIKMKHASKKDPTEEKVYFPQTIPDKTEDLLNGARKYNRLQAERRHREWLQWQKMKHDRIVATKIDKYVHALNVIIEKTEEVQSGASPIHYESAFSISYYNFNFEIKVYPIVKTSNRRFLEPINLPFQNIFPMAFCN